MGSAENSVINDAGESSELSWGYFPSTCEKCPNRGKFRYDMFDTAVWVDDWHMQSRKNVHDFKWQVDAFPERCNDCHAKAERFRKANQTLRKLENIRELLEVNDLRGKDWLYLKFVTLTWKNDWQREKPQLSKKELAAARLSIRRKRDKIAKKLDCAGGTDVMENVKSTQWGLADEFPLGIPVQWNRHHLHTHGIWIMPKFEVESVLKVMKVHGLRDQIRAIKPHEYYHKKLDKWIEVTGITKARNYLIKYLSKEKGLKRGNWGLARGKLTEERLIEFMMRT